LSRKNKITFTQNFEDDVYFDVRPDSNAHGDLKHQSILQWVRSLTWERKLFLGCSTKWQKEEKNLLICKELYAQILAAGQYNVMESYEVNYNRMLRFAKFNCSINSNRYKVWKKQDIVNNTLIVALAYLKHQSESMNALVRSLSLN
jgi:hypothetical protein